MRSKLRPAALVAVFVLLAPTGVALADHSFRHVYDAGAGRLEIDLVIGGEDADDDHLLYSASTLCVDSQGNMFVLDGKMDHIRKFAPDGTHLVTFGGDGEGPGKLRGARRMSLTPDGGLVVCELHNRRLSVFDSDGEFVRTIPFNEQLLLNVVAGPDGSMIVHEREVDFFDPHSKATHRLSRCSPEGTIGAVVDSFKVRDAVVIVEGDSRAYYAMPFSERQLWRMLPDGRLVIVHSGEERARVVDQSNQSTWLDTRKIARVKVTSEDRTEYLAELEGDDPSRFPPSHRRQFEFPDEKPVYQGLMVDEDGYVLLRLQEEPDGNPTYDVIDPEGQFVNTVVVPDLMSYAVLRHGFVYSAWFDPDDLELPAVKRYRLVAAD